jgi:hypothetical protein
VLANGGAELGYNQKIEWSAGWDAWDGAPVDTASEWAPALRTTDGSAQTVSITPRRGAASTTVWCRQRSRGPAPAMAVVR